jgi:hypothetical protein
MGAFVLTCITFLAQGDGIQRMTVIVCLCQGLVRVIAVTYRGCIYRFLHGQCSGRCLQDIAVPAAQLGSAMVNACLESKEAVHRLTDVVCSCSTFLTPPCVQAWRPVLGSSGCSVVHVVSCCACNAAVPPAPLLLHWQARPSLELLI